MTTGPTKRCTAPECAEPHAAKGLCRRHYWLHRRDALAQEACSVSGCDRPMFCVSLCRGHYARRQRGADVNVPLQPQPEPGTVRLTCRVSREALARLEAEATAANVTPSALAGRLLAESLGLAR